ncbi:nuclear transport factor 2 family protein [Phyllobacterium phragmitis]|uniref:SnoaL-like domain-containing protein n=1 Tax=Phyllobacterium phragmitis TaxID=2670329 RepID=A0ABQ0H5L6_9HYPH
MITVLFPVASPTTDAETGSSLPIELHEVGGRMVFDYALSPFLKLKRMKRLLSVVHGATARSTGLEAALAAESDHLIEIIRLFAHTEGAVCTCLMAADSIDPDQPLIISSLDQVVETDLDEVMDYFEAREADAGVLTFSSRNPKFSYAAIQNGQIVQTAEKRPITHHALAGLYYYKTGALFLKAAQTQIYKRATQFQNQFYLSGTINELVIEGKRVVPYEIRAESYHKFYTPYMLDVYAARLGLKGSMDNRLSQDTKRYVEAFNAGNLEAIENLLDDNVVLNEIRRRKYTGKPAVMGLFADLLGNKKKPPRLEPVLIHASVASSTSVLEFRLEVDGATFEGTDIITWQDGHIRDMQAYVL